MMQIPSDEKYRYTPIQDTDGEAIIEIFNYYILHSDAAFPEEEVPVSFFEMMRPFIIRYPSVAVRDESGACIGFGMLRPHNPMPAFDHTSEISYFIRQDHTGEGIGKAMLSYLEEGGRKQGINRILAPISSRNEGSIRFHQKAGFVECGRFHKVGKKRGVLFDTVWMEKEL